MIKEYLDACMPLAEVDILGRLNWNAMRKAIPLNVTLELTMNCNFRCQHCYNYDRSLAKPPQEEVPLTPAEILRLMDDLAKIGTLYISFTGGEAALNPNLLEYIRAARARNMVPRLKSNGALLTEKRCEALRAAGLDAVNISLYGGSPETHEPFTRTKGTFHKTIEGIQHAQNAGLNPDVNIILHKGNFREFPKMRKLLEDLKVPFGTAIDISVRNDGSTSSLEHRLDKADLEELFQYPGAEGFLEKRQFDNLQCGCARINCGISYFGAVYPCVGAPLFCGSIRESSFAEIWKESPQLNWIRNLGKKDYKDCISCDLKKYCPRNSGVSFSNSGDYTAKDDWSCMTAGMIRQHAPKPAAPAN